jgi:hypothetical protein
VDGRCNSISRHSGDDDQGVEPYRKFFIASAAKQSILSLLSDMDCFAAPVIERAFARPFGSQ